MAADKVEKAWDDQAVFLFDDGDRYYCPSVLYKDAVAFFNTWTAQAAKYEMEAKIEEARASCVQVGTHKVVVEKRPKQPGGGWEVAIRTGKKQIWSIGSGNKKPVAASLLGTVRYANKLAKEKDNATKEAKQAEEKPKEKPKEKRGSLAAGGADSIDAPSKPKTKSKKTTD